MTTPKRRFVTCCGVPLSEWFIDRHREGWWGMVCRFAWHPRLGHTQGCGRVYPYLTHQEFRDEHGAKEPRP